MARSEKDSEVPAAGTAAINERGGSYAADRRAMAVVLVMLVLLGWLGKARSVPPRLPAVKPSHTVV